MTINTDFITPPLSKKIQCMYFHCSKGLFTCFVYAECSILFLIYVVFNPYLTRKMTHYDTSSLLQGRPGHERSCGQYTITKCKTYSTNSTTCHQELIRPISINHRAEFGARLTLMGMCQLILVLTPDKM